MHEYGVDIPVCDDKAGYRKWIRNNEAYIREKYYAWVNAHREEIERESGLKLRLERLQSLERLQELQRLKDSLHIFQIEGLYVPKEQACDLVDYVQVKLF